MTTDVLTLNDKHEPGVVAVQRSSLAVLLAIVRDPLRGLPPSVFEQRMTVSRTLGATRIYVSDPALIHELIVRKSDALEKGFEANRVLTPALGSGLLTANGAHWRWQRQTIAPTFQHDKLMGLLPAMIAAAEATRERWLARPAGTTLDIGHEMMLTTFEIIVETMLSGDAMDVALVERSVTDYLKSTSWRFALALLKAPDWVPFPGRGRSRRGSRAMRGAVREMVAQRRRTPGRQDDLVALLIGAADPETGRKMTDTEITDNILTFIGAGHETTAVALSWIFMLLSDQPACVARILAEIDGVVGGGAIEPEHIVQLAYTRQVVNEAMRLYPPAPLISRSVLQDIELGGLTISAGSVVLVPIYAVHRHASLWDRPDVFDPDRFAPEAAKARHRFAFMPFGAGPRVCIGSAFATMEAVALLAVLLRAARLDRVAPEIPRPTMRITLRPTESMMMRVSPR